MTDLTILGGGAAGCRAAMLAAKAGLDVTLLEGDALGGAAAHEGYWCYRRLLKDAAEWGAARRGVNGLALRPDAPLYDLAREHMRAASTDIIKSGRDTMEALGVQVIHAAGHVKGLRNRRYVVTTGEGEGYESRRLLIATGSIPSAPDSVDLSDASRKGMILSPRDLLKLPSAMGVVILGGTVRDLQMAAWLAANQVSVTLLSPTAHIAEELDDELTAWLFQTGRLGSIHSHIDAKLASVTLGRATISTSGGGQSIRCDKLVLGGRRHPATRGIGLGGAAIALDNTGAVVTDLTGRTNLPDVYAAGDVNGRTQTALGAFLEAETVVANMLGERICANYAALPVLFKCGLGAASVGDTEDSAAARGVKAVSVTVPVAGRREDGFVKIVADTENRVIGAHICHQDGETGVIWGLAEIVNKALNAKAAARKITPDSLLADTAQQALLQF
ncbi:dihydrolipoyl dehydrogenase [Clostridia bacterium]|nr:dihydrolipoyl dehydrogenase [Clostridia bacterium]